MHFISPSDTVWRHSDAIRHSFCMHPELVGSPSDSVSEAVGAPSWRPIAISASNASIAVTASIMATQCSLRAVRPTVRPSARPLVRPFGRPFARVSVRPMRKRSAQSTSRPLAVFDVGWMSCMSKQPCSSVSHAFGNYLSKSGY